MKCFIMCLLISISSVYALAAETNVEDFNQYRDTILKSVKDVSSYQAIDAYNEIKGNLEKFQAIYQKVQSVEHVDNIIDEVAIGLDAIATSYEKIAAKRETILQYREDKMLDLTDIEGKTLKTIEELQQEKQQYDEKIATRQKDLESEQNEIEKKKIKIDLKAYSNVVNSLEAQISIWEKFSTAQTQLKAKLDLNTQQIDLMMYILERNAQVYREAANVVKLRRSAVIALKNLAALSDMQDVLSELETSWYDVDILVNEISEVDFKIE